MGFRLAFSPLLISGQVYRESATEPVVSCSIPGQIKSKTIKIGFYSFPAWRLSIKGTV